MKLMILTAANVLHAKAESVSLKTAQIIAEHAKELHDDVQTKIVSLLDAELKPCIMCGACYPSWQCSYDADYNCLLQEMISADALIVVVPHYAPIPSKLSIVLEKIQEMCFIQMCTDKTAFFLKNKIAVIVAHGGSPKEYIEAYKDTLITPIYSALKGVGINVLKINDEWPKGIAFGVTGFEPVKGSIFPRAIHDWDDISNTLSSVVKLTLETVLKERA